MKPMKVGDLVALSSYGENLDALYPFTDFYCSRYREDNIPLRGIIVKVDTRYSYDMYYIKWMKSHAPIGRDGRWGCEWFERKDLKYVSRA
tara:strand:- start:398 stop:667 length:270 start_codon:yes stop_codon:yes gene_type:complete